MGVKSPLFYLVINMHYRLATVNDALEIRQIYAQYIDTSITFEYELPSEEAFTERVRNIIAQYPYIVCINDDGKIIGYAYATKFRERVAYQWCAETSIYIDKTQSTKGIGKKLYTALIEILTLQGFRNVYGCITVPNDISEKFHSSLGFKHVATFNNSGFKAGNWYSVVFYEKIINEYSQPTDVISIGNISKPAIEQILEHIS